MRVIDFIHKFKGVNAGLFLFAGGNLNQALVPLCGNNNQSLVNNGFVDGDVTSQGIQGDGTSSLTSMIASESIDVTNCFAAVWCNFPESGTFNSAVQSSVVNQFIIQQNSSNNIVFRLNGGTGGYITIANDLAERYFAFNATASNVFNVYFNTTLKGSTMNTRTTLSTGNIRLFPFGDNVFLSFVAISPTQSLTADQRTTLYNATVALDTARALL